MLLSGFKLPVEHLSASAIADFLTCPERYRQERVLKVPKKRNLDAFIGSVHHDTVEENFAQKIHSAKDMSLDQQSSVYRYKWAEAIEIEGEPVWTEHPDNVEALGLKMLGAFHADVAPTIHPIAVEQRFEDNVPGVPVPIIGYLDVLENETIQEFKTAKQKTATPKANWRFQAMIYQLFLRQPVYWTVTTKQKTPVNWFWQNAPGLVLQPGHPDVAAQMVRQAAEMLNECWQRYGRDNPWPLTGLMHTWACDYCSIGPKHPDPSCPAWRKP